MPVGRSVHGAHSRALAARDGSRTMERTSPGRAGTCLRPSGGPRRTTSPDGGSDGGPDGGPDGGSDGGSDGGPGA